MSESASNTKECPSRVKTKAIQNTEEWRILVRFWGVAFSGVFFRELHTCTNSHLPGRDAPKDPPKKCTNLRPHTLFCELGTGTNLPKLPCRRRSSRGLTVTCTRRGGANSGSSVQHERHTENLTHDRDVHENIQALFSCLKMFTGTFYILDPRFQTQFQSFFTARISQAQNFCNFTSPEPEFGAEL